jgi:hypothetical protein
MQGSVRRGGHLDTVEMVQLATRIPRRVHRAVKLRCVEVGGSMSRFVADAIREKLARVGTRRYR